MFPGIFYTPYKFCYKQPAVYTASFPFYQTEKMKSKELKENSNVYLKLFSDLVSATTNYANLHVKDTVKNLLHAKFMFSPQHVACNLVEELKCDLYHFSTLVDS